MSCEVCERPCAGKLCKRCDLKRRRASILPPQPCENCGKRQKWLTNRRCNACRTYFERNAVERPERLWRK